jgi:hypothetical protein
MPTSTVVAIFFASVLGGAIGSQVPLVYAKGPGIEVLQSKSFVLLDGAGHKRGEWKMDPSGQPVVRLFDARGHIIWDTTVGVRLLAHEP